MPQRHLTGLRQSLEFQPGTGSLAGRFTINVCWTFTLAGPHDGAFHASRRIGGLAGGADVWYSARPPQLDEDFDRAAALLLRVALPYLQRHASVESIVTAYEQGDITVQQAFGPSRCWQLFHLGFCYASLGRTNDARISLKALIEEHSSEPWEWVQERKIRAQQQLALLTHSQ